MSLVISTNIMALNAHRSLKRTSASNADASERLSTGNKINKAADDAASLAISTGMRTQIISLSVPI